MLPVRIWRGIRLLLFLLAQIVISSLAVTVEVLKPRLDLRPGIIAVPLDVRSDIGITILSSLITLTPGTLSIDVSSDRGVMYVHALNFRDPEEFRRHIKQEFEQRIIGVFQ